MRMPEYITRSEVDDLVDRSPGFLLDGFSERVSRRTSFLFRISAEMLNTNSKLSCYHNRVYYSRTLSRVEQGGAAEYLLLFDDVSDPFTSGRRRSIYRQREGGGVLRLTLSENSSRRNPGDRSTKSSTSDRVKYSGILRDDFSSCVGMGMGMGRIVPTLNLARCYLYSRECNLDPSNFSLKFVYVV